MRPQTKCKLLELSPHSSCQRSTSDLCWRSKPPPNSNHTRDDDRKTGTVNYREPLYVVGPVRKAQVAFNDSGENECSGQPSATWGAVVRGGKWPAVQGLRMRRPAVRWPCASMRRLISRLPLAHRLTPVSHPYSAPSPPTASSPYCFLPCLRRHVHTLIPPRHLPFKSQRPFLPFPIFLVFFHTTCLPSSPQSLGTSFSASPPSQSTCSITNLSFHATLVDSP